MALERHETTTVAENEVLRLVARGLSDQAIAVDLGIKERTVQRRLERSYARTGLHGRAASAWAALHQECCLDVNNAGTA